ncbi:MAG: NAD(P)-dependent alcohol dehydrogenase [Pseudomonadota bacterium]
MDTTFEAWDIPNYGAPEVLSPVRHPMPTPAEDQILVRIRASAVTRADGMMRAGHPKIARVFLGLSRPRAGLSGTCFSGEVVGLGSAVTRFKIGEAVFGEAGLKFGANASHICVSEEGSILAKPDTLNFEEAAVMFDGAMTSWHFLTHVAPVKPKDRVLILGGSGSLGSAAIQIATALGAQVTATSSTRNGELLSALGATRVIDYTRETPFQAGARYDLVFDTLGVSSFGAAKPSLARNGRYACPVLGLGLLRDVMLTRFFSPQRAVFSAAGLQTPEHHRKQLTGLLSLVADGRFAPVMDRTYPFADLVEAHRYVATGRKRGNVVVV